MNKAWLILLIMLLPKMLSAEPLPQNTAKGSWYTLSAENDAFGVLHHSDNGYSNGISYSWGHVGFDAFDTLAMPQWIRAISTWTWLNDGSNKDYAIAYGVAQGMYTPEEIEDPELNPDDRPYAGTLLWKPEINSIATHYANNMGLTLGVVGPASLAEYSQKITHKLIGAAEPQGWEHQIGNEPVFRVEAERIQRLGNISLTDTTIVDVLAIGEAAVGNLKSDIGGGLGLRIGNTLNNNFAFYHPLAGRAANTFAAERTNRFSWQFVASVYGSYVFNDITLDGNTFKDSHSVELIHEQAFVSLSAACSWYNWGIIFSTQRGTEQFEGQPDITNFGALSVTYNH